jgi:hypothetical protein
MRMVNSTMLYGYEFCNNINKLLIKVGAFSRLVITPLTERCWLTICMAF